MVRLTDRQIQELERTLDDEAVLKRMGAAVIHNMLEQARAGKDLTEIRMKLGKPDIGPRFGDLGPVYDTIGIDTCVSWNKEIDDIANIPKGLEGGKRLRIDRPTRAQR